MYIIIVGAGKVGYHLGSLLMAEGHEVMLIEEDRSKVELLSLEFHDAIMQGNGSTVEVLREAGANRADVLVATTGNDEEQSCDLPNFKIDVSPSPDHCTGEQSKERGTFYWFGS